MPYRSSKEKFIAHDYARKLFVEDGLSLKEISQQTGQTVKTIRAWRNLGNWTTQQEDNAKTELERLESLRDGLLDRAEAQLKEGKMPHTELGLMHKLEKLIDQREKSQDMVDTIMVNTLQYLGNYLIEYDKELARDFYNHFPQFSEWISTQDLTRPLK